ncbi:XRE family transcriptional regulator [bacterium]|nr:XRE family transcriptional regulator [bacterium]MBU1995454.1 XRE family transcriptional regulator [bacterium]
MAIRTNHVFKGHKTLLGSRYVTYAEIELPTRSEIFSYSKDGFDWGHSGPSSIQLAFSILLQLSDEEFAKKNAQKFTTDIIKYLNKKDWILNTSDVVEWINNNRDVSQEETQKKDLSIQIVKKSKKNVVKIVCSELGITQKNLAEILEVPEGTVSSWAVKNEIPRLGKKAIEFYMLNKKNQDIVDSYKSFLKLLDNA